MHETIATISQAGEKPTNEELNARIDEVADLWRKGVQKREIARYVSTKTSWNISSRSLDRYIARAKKKIAKEGEQSRAVAVGFLNCGYRELFARAMMDKSYDAVNTALLRFGRLYGIELGDQAKSHDGDPDERDNRIAILVAPDRLPNTEEGRKEWDRRVRQRQANLANPQPSILALEPTPLLRTTEKPKAPGE